MGVPSGGQKHQRAARKPIATTGGFWLAATQAQSQSEGAPQRPFSVEQIFLSPPAEQGKDIRSACGDSARNGRRPQLQADARACTTAARGLQALTVKKVLEARKRPPASRKTRSSHQASLRAVLRRPPATAACSRSWMP